METFIMQYVTPQLSSSEPYLRAIVCAVHYETESQVDLIYS